MSPQIAELKKRFRELPLPAYQAYCDRIAESLSGIEDDTERERCQESLRKIRRWFKFRQDFGVDIEREISTIERALE